MISETKRLLPKIEAHWKRTSLAWVMCGERYERRGSGCRETNLAYFLLENKVTVREVQSDFLFIVDRFQRAALRENELEVGKDHQVMNEQWTQSYIRIQEVLVRSVEAKALSHQKWTPKWRAWNEELMAVRYGGHTLRELVMGLRRQLPWPSTLGGYVH